VKSKQSELANSSTEPGRKRFASIIKGFLLFTALAVLALLLFCIVNAYRLPDANNILARAKLAKLPESISNLEVDTCRATVDGRTVFNEAWLFIRFQADPNDIDRFLSNSPGIDKSRFRALSTASYSDENPAWWSIDHSASGRIYSLPDGGDIRAGNVIVNEDSSTVHLFIWIVAHRRVHQAQNSLENLYGEIEDRVEDLTR
jgi:hypothetical protein